MRTKVFLGALAVAGLAAMAVPALAQQTQSRLYDITKNHRLRVCQFPLYYSISYRNPKTGEIEGIDADLSKAVLVSAVHTLAMVAAGGCLALLAYRYLGLKFVSRSWFNLDAAWAASLILVGSLSLASGLAGWL